MMGYALSDLQTLARQFTRIAQSSDMYTDTNVDNAIMLAGEEWVRLVKPSRTLSTLTLTAASSTLPTMPSGWLPDYQIQCDLLAPSGQVVLPDFHFGNYADVLRAQAYCGNSIPSGRPSIFGFKDPTEAMCFPTPDLAYLLYLWWWNPFPTWVAGGTAGSFAAVPDEQLRIIATDGVESKLQVGEPENQKLVMAAQARFTDKMWQIKGRDAGGRGGQLDFKDNPDSCRSRTIYEASF